VIIVTFCSKIVGVLGHPITVTGGGFAKKCFISTTAILKPEEAIYLNKFEVVKNEWFMVGKLIILIFGTNFVSISTRESQYTTRTSHGQFPHCQTYILEAFMMFPRRKSFSSALLVVLGLAFMVFANGCSNSSMPLGPTQAEEQSVETQAQPAKKLGGLVGGLVETDLVKGVTYTADSVVNYQSQVETDSDIFVFGRSEDLWVKFGLYSDYLAGDIQILEAKFYAGRRSVPSESGKVEIIMEAHSGTTMDDILVNFEPHGFDFDPRYPAKLQLTLVGKDVPETRDGYHHHEPDDVEKIDVSYQEYNGILMKVVVITIKVPGFSMYSLGGDDVPEAETESGGWY